MIVMEIDGPPCAYVKSNDLLFAYKLCHLFAHDSGQLMAAYAHWRKNLGEEYARCPFDTLLVWRVRPAYERLDSGWTLRMRWAVVPFPLKPDLQLHETKEGEPLNV